MDYWVQTLVQCEIISQTTPCQRIVGNGWAVILWHGVVCSKKNCTVHGGIEPPSKDSESSMLPLHQWTFDIDFVKCITASWVRALVLTKLRYQWASSRVPYTKITHRRHLILTVHTPSSPMYVFASQTIGFNEFLEAFQFNPHNNSNRLMTQHDKDG